MRALFLAQLSNGVIDDYVTSFDRHSGYFQAVKHFGDFRRPMFSLRHLERFDRNRTFPSTTMFCVELVRWVIAVWARLLDDASVQENDRRADRRG